MRPAHIHSRLSAVLAASVVLVWPSLAFAWQYREGRAEREARELITVAAAVRQDPIPPRQAPPGPGSNVTFPDDPVTRPLNPNATGLAVSHEITPDLLKHVDEIEDNYDRSRALLEIAREAILSNQLQLAHDAVERAGVTALVEPNPLRHDQLIIEDIVTTSSLTEALIRERQAGQNSRKNGDGDAEARKGSAGSPVQSIAMAREEWRRSGDLARHIINPTYQNEYLARVADGLSRDSSHIIGEYIENPDLDALMNEADRLSDDDLKKVKEQADVFLVDALNIANTISRPIWRNEALMRTAIAAGQSRQFPRAVHVASTIDNAESRAQALILVAESQGAYRDTESATETYSRAAQAVACIEQGGLRGVVNGYLVDSLISAGRFEDARACLGLYPTESERFVALGAIAESQGRRGGAEKARAWIARDVPEIYRSNLYRRVNNGVLAAISNERQNQYSSREDLPALPRGR